MATRVETDTMGAIEVPADRYWGAQTERSRRHFAIGEERFPRPFLRALGRLKRAAAGANAALGGLEQRKADAIAQAAGEVVDGALDDHFPLVVWQTGSGTQSNMNANEVIANRAIELLGGTLGSKDPIHPNDDVNRSQSSNDVVPTAIHVAAVEEIRVRLLPELRAFYGVLDAKAGVFSDTAKVARTHLMDAIPMRAGDEWRAFAAQIEAATARLAAGAEGLLGLPIGGTAVGSGLNAPGGFDAWVVEALRAETGFAFEVAANKFAGIAAHDALVGVHGDLRALAVALSKIANDIRLLASGPRCGIGELRLPANEPGSSIMPGKVNPTQCEALGMVCMQVMGNDVAVGLGGAGGHLQLNANKPLLAFNLLNSVRWLGDACTSFRVHCLEGLDLDRANTRRHLERSLMWVTLLVPRIGYDAAAAVAKRAHEGGISLREAAIGAGALSGEEFDELVALDPVPGLR